MRPLTVTLSVDTENNFPEMATCVCYAFTLSITLYILVAYVTTTCGTEKDVVLIHSYPRDNDFNYVELTCKELNASHDMCTEQTAFYLNQTDIKHVLNVTACSNGTIAFMFSQSDEGEFACSQNGTMSNSIALAGTNTHTLVFWILLFTTVFFTKTFTAEPGIQLNGTRTERRVLLQTPDDQVPTTLQCDIQPGALRQRYSARWYQLSMHPNNTVSDVLTFIPELNFNLMLNVTKEMNHSRYLCEVTINHNGSLFRTYMGANITLNVDIVGEYVRNISKHITIIAIPKLIFEGGRIWLMQQAHLVVQQATHIYPMLLW